MEKIMVAMSGGVDSSAAALLVKQAGLEAVGVTLSLRREEREEIFPGEKTCCSADDVNDARMVCARLGIPFYVFNFQEDFREQVIDRFVNAYCQGKTPNPASTATGTSSLESCSGGRRKRALIRWLQAIMPGWSGTRLLGGSF